MLAGLLAVRVFVKLDQRWYQCRALAESIKTSSWRFSLRSHPFGNSESIQTPKANFRNYLREIILANKHLGEVLEAGEGDGEQVTESMLATRTLSTHDRLEFYLTNRVKEQRKWYASKVGYNRKRQSLYLTVIILLYIASCLFLLGNQLGIPSLSPAFDPTIVAITGILGWLQIKRHGELAASYNLTAHEIGVIQGEADSVQDEESLSEFVNEAELAFSREHTQWTARKEIQ